MARVYDNPYWTSDSSGSQVGNFDQLGHPGKHFSVLRYNGGQLDLTGSNYGYGSILINTHANASASLSGGGSIPLSQLGVNTMHELSVSQLKGGGATAIVYLFKRQQ